MIQARPHVVPLVILASLLALSGRPAHAVDGRTAYLVRDLDPGEAYESTIALDPVATLGNRVLLTAGDPASGSELWVTDGTGVGTRLLVDACPGPCSSVIRVLGTLGGKTIWAAAPTDRFGSANRSWRLWITDGTRAGTRPLTEPGALPDDPEGETFAFTGGRLYFAGCTTADSCGLWTTDGTPEGTGPVPGLASTHGRPSQLTAVGDRVFFNAFNELWVSDGSGPGSVRLKSFAQPGLPEALTAAGGRLFLIANDGQGSELWTSDGTAAGTRALTQLAPANPFPATADSFDPWIFKVAGPLVYFIVNDVLHEDELWRSDGTSTGTFALTDFDFHQPFGDDFENGFFAVVGGRFLFQATDGFEDSAIWVTTGSRESTRPLAAECPSCALPPARNVGASLISTGTRLLFPAVLADDPRGGIWTSDGTARGTRPLDCGGTCGNLFSDPVAGSGGMYFNTTSRSGLDLWFTDGTTAGTHRLTAFPQGGPDAAQVRYSLPVRTPDGRFFFNVYNRDHSSRDLWISRGSPASSQLFLSATDLVLEGSPHDLRPLGERLFFLACGPEIGLWETAGSAASTVPVWTEPSSYCDSTAAPYGLTAVGDTLFFLSREGSEHDQLWRTGPAGPVRLTDFAAGRAIVFRQPVVLGGRIYFEVHTDSPYQSEVWRSDGTAQGTVKAFEISGGRLEHMVAVGDELYLLVADGTQRIWRSDGTPAGTREILNAGSGFLEFFYEGDEILFARLGARVFFTALGSSDKPEIWETDGTAAGTHRVAELPERASPNKLQSWGLVAFQGALYFFAGQGNRAELWRSDGTQFGTFLLRAFEDPGFYRRERGLTPFGGALYFAASGGQEGEELWRTDGTPAGTVPVRDISPGAESSSPASFTVAAGRLYFAATEPVHGRELWESDGTAIGTRLVQDIAPLASSSAPADLTVAGDRLYFAADDGLAGRELWALSLTGTGCQPSPAHLCLGDGRFQVEIAWQDFEGNAGAGTAVPLTGDTGYFWFFDPANVEAVVKVLDGQGLNGHQWVFYGALSNVEYTLTVTDTQTGLSRRYRNPSGVFASVGDTEGFGPRGAYSTVPAAAPRIPAAAPRAERSATAPAGSCQAGPERLCLNGGRFAVEVAWKDFQGNTGRGQAVPLSGDTGYFWFFDAANVELVTKALDGTALNGKFWFFYGALSNVEYRITVTDTTTGKTKTYTNPAGRFASVGDTAAF